MPSIEPGKEVFIKHRPGIVSVHTPAWCESWKGKVIRLNKQTVTVEFEVDEKDKPTVREYIDYQDICVHRDGEWVWIE